MAGGWVRGGGREGGREGGRKRENEVVRVRKKDEDNSTIKSLHLVCCPTKVLL